MPKINVPCELPTPIRKAKRCCRESRRHPNSTMKLKARSSKQKLNTASLGSAQEDSLERSGYHQRKSLPSVSQSLQEHCASIPAPDPVDSDPLWAYSLPPQATDGLILQDIDPPAELKPFSGTCVFPATSNQQVGGDSDFPVPHGKTGYVPCALAGNNAQCPFTVVIRQNNPP